MLVNYAWDCDLGEYSNQDLDRYRCSYENLEMRVALLSSSSEIDRREIIEEIVDHGMVRRRVRNMRGIRFRFDGSGGCSEEHYQFIKVSTKATSDGIAFGPYIINLLGMLEFTLNNLATAQFVLARGSHSACT